MKNLILCVLLLALFLLACYEDTSYYRNSGWDCTAEQFEERYFDLFAFKIDELKSKHNIECTQINEVRSDSLIVITLYNDEFTCYFRFGCVNFVATDLKNFGQEDGYGGFDVELYFYGSDENDLYSYSAQEKYVNFLNDVTCAFAFDIEYDLETNIYYDTYSYCIDNNQLAHNNLIHSDSLVDELSYGVRLKYEGASSDYKLEGNEELAIKCNMYYYKGLLRGTLES